MIVSAKALTQWLRASGTLSSGRVNLTFPVLLWNRALAPEAWFHRLQCTLAAYRDLGCEGLLDMIA